MLLSHDQRHPKGRMNVQLPCSTGVSRRPSAAQRTAPTLAQIRSRNLHQNNSAVDGRRGPALAIQSRWLYRRPAAVRRCLLRPCVASSSAVGSPDDSSLPSGTAPDTQWNPLLAMHGSITEARRQVKKLDGQWDKFLPMILVSAFIHVGEALYLLHIKVHQRCASAVDKTHQEAHFDALFRRSYSFSCPL